ncbi:MAG TPA: hypothetical protein VFU14_20400 [Acidimicrobiales bacterium]|nr:hypothetical protein [Acidimicrobiales bacterium]
MASTVCPCGAPIPAERRKHRARYCSQRCQWRYKERNANGSTERFASATCDGCGVPIPQDVRPGHPTRRCAACRPQPLPPATRRVCPVCRASFDPPAANRVYCSPTCRKRARGNRGKLTHIAGKAVRSQSRRVKWKAAVLARYGAVCWLCDQPIDLHLRYPDPWSYSPDHVVNICDGGAPYDVANGRPAHLRCNLSRGAADGNRRRKLTRRTALTW